MSDIKDQKLDNDKTVKVVGGGKELKDIVEHCYCPTCNCITDVISKTNETKTINGESKSCSPKVCKNCNRTTYWYQVETKKYCFGPSGMMSAGGSSYGNVLEDHYFDDYGHQGTYTFK